jgi:hypothetical protein
MKRFLLFAGDNVYPSGGMEDFIDAFQTPEDARDRLINVLEDNEPCGMWAHIYDAETMTMVYEL